ncbi:MAG: GNAT family N-acetyltransferase [Acidobacteria bacterium]|nr:GNAT family N-acetyltransferase [Acidobacteriota bacterium]
MISTLPQSITLRPAQADDEAFLFKLYASTRAQELAAWGWPEAQQEAFLQMQYRAQRGRTDAYPNTEHSIVLSGAESIGRMLVAPVAGQIYLIDIALLPAWRGQGIGAALLQDLLASAAEAVKSVALHVEQHNPAQRLYQRLGFVFRQTEGVHLLLEWQPPQSS